MIRKRAPERKAPTPTLVVQPLSVDTVLHALNTFPKAFLLWGIMDTAPLRPKEMEERLHQNYPFLEHFTFLNRNNFNQYCQRSLRDILQHDTITLGSNGSSKQAPTFRLNDTTIKAAAGFLLRRCVDLGVNCEDFMATGRNSCPLSNSIRITMVERLSQICSQTVESLAQHVNADTTTIDRHLVKMAAHGLVDYVVPETENEIRKRSVKGAYARITKKGQDVAREVLRPLISYLNGQSRYESLVRETQPDQATLIKAMELYATGPSFAEAHQD